MLLGLLTLLAFAVVTAWAAHRLASLIEARATSGSRKRRSLTRQIGAVIGWWLIGTGLVLIPLTDGFMAVTLAPLGALLVLCAIISRKRGDAPLFWAAP